MNEIKVVGFALILAGFGIWFSDRGSMVEIFLWTGLSLIASVYLWPMIEKKLW